MAEIFNCPLVATMPRIIPHIDPTLKSPHYFDELKKGWRKSVLLPEVVKHIFFPSFAWLCVSVCLPAQIRVGEFCQLNGTELKTRRCLRNTVFVHVPMVLEYSIPKKWSKSTLSPRNVYGHVTLVYVLVWFCMCVCSYPCVYVIVFVTMFKCARHCISSPPRWYVCVRSSQWEAYYP